MFAPDRAGVSRQRDAAGQIVCPRME
jgi:hypothetical protein